jgi:hypothetical protein
MEWHTNWIEEIKNSKNRWNNVRESNKIGDWRQSDTLYNQWHVHKYFVPPLTKMPPTALLGEKETL